MTEKQRKQVYTSALIAYGDRIQMTVALEEMAECHQAICKILRGGENFDHLAEEVADAIICLEQMRLLFNIDERVEHYIESKVHRLESNLRKDGYIA